jgi:nitroreductase
MSKSQHDALAAAADAALLAPSIFNTQPWRWRVDGASLELFADGDRRLGVVDPDGHLLLLSCGIALHHGRIALAAAGWGTVVETFDDPTDPDRLARIRLVEPIEPPPGSRAMADAISRRRTDRRPFSPRDVTADVIDQLVAAADREGVALYDTKLEHMPMLAIAVAMAQSREVADPEYRQELRRWTNRPMWSKDGVPPSTGVAHAPRRVPVRDFVEPPHEGIAVEPGGDLGAHYLILHGSADSDVDWLRAGQAASAVLLTAVSLGLATAPISDVIEVERPRELLRGILRGAGHPYLVIRCGYPTDTTPIDPVPRRGPGDAVDGAQP